LDTKRTGIVIINWNGAADTIECLQSFNFELTDQYIFVIDNQSSDDSLQRLVSYFQGTAKKFRYEENEKALSFDPNIHFYLIKSSSNRGFAGGNNHVMGLLMTDPSFQYFWLLNNDTVITENSLPELIKTIDSAPDVGFAGSVIMDFYKTNLIQCVGGTLLPWLGVTRLVLKNSQLAEINDTQLKRTDYQSGASLLVKKQVLDRIGLLDEIFFMYSEEADWQARATRVGIRNLTATKSLIYHKGTVSTNNRKHLFYYYYNRSSIIMIRRNFSWAAVLSACIFLPVITFIRASFNPKNSYFGFKGVIHGLSSGKHTNKQIS
jgi:GT2 family glycosyltransferase